MDIPLNTLNKELFKEVSIKNDFQKRDEFLEKLVNTSTSSEQVKVANELLFIVETKRPYYEKANALTCAAVLFWINGEAQKAYGLLLISEQMIKFVKGKNINKNKLTFLVKKAMDCGIPVSEFLPCFSTKKLVITK